MPLVAGEILLIGNKHHTDICNAGVIAAGAEVQLSSESRVVPSLLASAGSRRMYIQRCSDAPEKRDTS